MKRFGIIGLAALALAGCTQVDEGYRGVWATYGAVDLKEAPAAPGFYWYNPWPTDIFLMDVRQQKWGAKTETYTKDVQKADLSFVINFHLNPAKASVMYSRVGLEWKDNIIPQVVAQAIKNEFGRWDAVRVVENRGQVAANIATALRETLASQDIILDSFDLVDIKYAGAFEDAVERKQVAIQKATEEQNNTIAVTERGKQAVITAEANAKALKATSDALEANPKLIQYEGIKAWRETGGKMPTTLVIGDGKATPPFIFNQP